VCGVERDGRSEPRNDWPRTKQEDTFARLDDEMRDAADAIVCAREMIAQLRLEISALR